METSGIAIHLFSDLSVELDYTRRLVQYKQPISVHCPAHASASLFIDTNRKLFGIYNRIDPFRDKCDTLETHKHSAAWWSYMHSGDPSTIIICTSPLIKGNNHVERHKRPQKEKLYSSTKEIRPKKKNKETKVMTYSAKTACPTSVSIVIDAFDQS